METKEISRPKRKYIKYFVILSLILIIGIGAIQLSKQPMLIQETKDWFSEHFSGILSGEARATKEQYDKLEIGMTMDDVKECLGRDVFLTRSEADTYMFIIEYVNGKEDTATLVFNGDKLIQKVLFSEQRSFKG